MAPVFDPKVGDQGMPCIGGSDLSHIRSWQPEGSKDPKGFRES